jgi:VanZ family protein
MQRRTLAGLLWLALLCWACGILVLSSLTPQELPEAAFLFWDKANHFLAYALGGWLAASVLRVSRPGIRIATGAILAVIAIAVFGALDELLQTFTPGRSGGDIFDWTADLLGAVAGALISLLTYSRLERLLRRP